MVLKDVITVYEFVTPILRGPVKLPLNGCG